MLTSFSFFLCLAFFSAVAGFAISAPPSIQAGAATIVSWSRNSPADPSQFVLRLRDLSLGNSAGSLINIDSQGNKDGQESIQFPKQGSFLIEAYGDDKLSNVIASSGTILVRESNNLAPAAPPSSKDKPPKPPKEPEPPPHNQSSTDESLTKKVTSVIATPTAIAPTSEKVFPMSSGIALSTIPSGSVDSTATSSTSVSESTDTPEPVASMNKPMTISSNTRAAIIVSSLFASLGLLTISLLIIVKVRRAHRKLNTAEWVERLSERELSLTGGDIPRRARARSSARVSKGYAVKTEMIIANNSDWNHLSEVERNEKQLKALRQMQAPKIGRKGSIKA